jgi:DNA-binding SARP family transcriptional activator
MQNLAATALPSGRTAVTCLGAFAVAVDGRPVTHFPTDKVRALLTYLALEPGPHRRWTGD